MDEFVDDASLSVDPGVAIVRQLLAREAGMDPNELLAGLGNEILGSGGRESAPARRNPRADRDKQALIAELRGHQTTAESAERAAMSEYDPNGPLHAIARGARARAYLAEQNLLVKHPDTVVVGSGAIGAMAVPAPEPMKAGFLAKVNIPPYVWVLGGMIVAIGIVLLVKALGGRK